MDCGHLEKVFSADGSRTGFNGEIRLQGIDFTDIGLRQCPEKRGDNSPDYDVYARGPGGYFQAGKAWVKPMKAGGDMLSITFDAPTMARPVYVAAFPDDEDRQPKGAKSPMQYTLQWSRPRAGVKASAAPVDLQDEVPV